ncbi:putative bifunctional diguanylate cyclase/phosphodiesterase [Methylobacterium sp. E-045]|uniref:putative bifunctional diguanylate cyclase/phosphodiesterase n=1 Tax=Methylobacterium sp. E-045 TaxID=2836575 RepID=UPI001FBAC590|nr:EAL domain-containing protein [Methylobacterium sp. E-045]MCJ2129242.1 EAL domain-containing protein [Methylobacterium sp. E-045]
MFHSLNRDIRNGVWHMKLLRNEIKFLKELGDRRFYGQIATRQLIELQPQVIWLYALISVNACALAFTHYSIAPVWLTIAVPGALLPICLIRGIHWWSLRPHEASDAEAVSYLRRTSLVTALLSIGFVSWGLALDTYGGPYERGHVAVFVAITVIACIFCLTHLPAAALIVTIIVMGSLIPYYLISGNDVFIAIAFNVLFVTIVMVRILLRNYADFVRLVKFQTETQRLIEENAALASTDSLTGLPNRRLFLKRLDSWVADQRTNGNEIALAIFDLDHFKPINDTYGHLIGDQVLIEIGRRLAELSDANTVFARLGGDEFGVVVRQLKNVSDARFLCDKISHELNKPVILERVQLVTGCSGGLAYFPEGGCSAHELFDRADYALYYSKENSRGAITTFSDEHENNIRGERAIEAALHDNDILNEMEIHYQPIFNTRLRSISSVEGLARWNSPSLGSIGPDRFIAAAERCGRIHTLTIGLLRKALDEARSLPEEIGLSFNLSAHDLISSATVISIVSAVRASKFAPNRLTLELTETALMRDFEAAHAAISTLRELGIKVALDDFGTGYSSLSYVHRLPLDIIKIDRSFILNIDSKLGSDIVTTVLNLCENLNLECVAEGVETDSQVNKLQLLGCHYVQGYLIGKPVPMQELLLRIQTKGKILYFQRTA